MSDRLREYEEARRKGGWGWKEEYDKKVSEKFSENRYPYLAGWYNGLLDEALEELDRTRAMLSQKFVIRIEKV